MAKSIELSLSSEEAEIVVDALETDLEGYEEAADEARSDGNKRDATTFAEAAARVRAVRDKLQKLID